MYFIVVKKTEVLSLKNLTSVVQVGYNAVDGWCVTSMQMWMNESSGFPHTTSKQKRALLTSKKGWQNMTGKNYKNVYYIYNYSASERDFF